MFCSQFGILLSVQLHTLCQIQKLPPSITGENCRTSHFALVALVYSRVRGVVSESDKRKIGIMCGQLQRSGYDPDGNIGSGFSDGGVSLPGVVFAVVVVACTYLLLRYFRSL